MLVFCHNTKKIVQCPSGGEWEWPLFSMNLWERRSHAAGSSGKGHVKEGRSLFVGEGKLDDNTLRELVFPVCVVLI